MSMTNTTTVSKENRTESAILYLIEVKGSNAAAARIGRHDEHIAASTSGGCGWCAATVQPHDLPDSATHAEYVTHPRATYFNRTGEKSRVALYASKIAAQRAIDAGEIWNGQAVRIRAARGEQRRMGVLLA